MTSNQPTHLHHHHHHHHHHNNLNEPDEPQEHYERKTLTEIEAGITNEEDQGKLAEIAQGKYGESISLKEKDYNHIVDEETDWNTSDHLPNEHEDRSCVATIKEDIAEVGDWFSSLLSCGEDRKDHDHEEHGKHAQNHLAHDKKSSSNTQLDLQP